MRRRSAAALSRCSPCRPARTEIRRITKAGGCDASDAPRGTVPVPRNSALEAFAAAARDAQASSHSGSAEPSPAPASRSRKAAGAPGASAAAAQSSDAPALLRAAGVVEGGTGGVGADGKPLPTCKKCGREFKAMNGCVMHERYCTFSMTRAMGATASCNAAPISAPQDEEHEVAVLEASAVFERRAPHLQRAHRETLKRPTQALPARRMRRASLSSPRSRHRPQGPPRPHLPASSSLSRRRRQRRIQARRRRHTSARREWARSTADSAASTSKLPRPAEHA